MPATDEPPVDRPKATDLVAPKTAADEGDTTSGANENDPESTAQKAIMRAALDDFLRRS